MAFSGALFKDRPIYTNFSYESSERTSVAQILNLFEFASISEQSGLSSSLCLEVMMTLSYFET